MHPRTLGTFVLLGGFVCPRPIALGIPPQPGEGVRESRWRLGRGFLVQRWRLPHEVMGSNRS
jgi:hypothetical protein